MKWLVEFALIYCMPTKNVPSIQSLLACVALKMTALKSAMVKAFNEIQIPEGHAATDPMVN